MDGYTQPCCDYYGSFEGELLGDNLGIFIVDEAFKRLLDKYEDRLIEGQAKLIRDLKKTFSVEIKSFNKSMNKLSDRVAALERASKKKGKKEEKEDEPK